MLRTLLLFGVFCWTAWGQSTPNLTDQPDPEDRNHGVARISLLSGDVSVRRGDSGEVIAAGLNVPIMVQDAVQTGPGARTEVQFDYATRMRLADNAEARIALLASDRFQVELARGVMSLSVLRNVNSQTEIDTPSVAIRPMGPGNYRIAVFEDGTTQITVRAGELHVESGRGEERVLAGQTMLARGPSDNPEYQIVAAIQRDEFDAFSERRDGDLERSASSRNVSRDIVGAEDLDSYGQWENDPTYGQVWAPHVAADWAPYRSGRWVWEDYYGWTWVSYDPWGWAPYHYGNWFNGARGWRWYPGDRYARHWYRPALVGFFGFGGQIGWVPLAPFERFHPWYGRGFASGYRGFGGGLNVVANFRNARVANGVTAVNSHDFTSGHFGRFANVGANELRGATLANGSLPAPGVGSQRFNDRQTSVTGRNSFSQTRFAGRTQQGSGAAAGSSAWQRFGSGGGQAGASFGRPAMQQPFRGERSGGGAARGGEATSWQRFGTPAARAPSASAPAARFGQAAPVYQNSSPRSYERPAGQYRDFGSRSVQVAPPMVRERAAPARTYSQPSAAPSRGAAPAQRSSGNSGGSRSGSRSSGTPRGR